MRASADPMSASSFTLCTVILAACTTAVRCWTHTAYLAGVPLSSSWRSAGSSSLLQLDMATAEQRASQEMELWLDLRQTVTTDEDGSRVTVASAYLDMSDAMIVDDCACMDDTSQGSTASMKKYTAQSDSNERNPLKIFACHGSSNEPVGAIVDVSSPSGQDMALGLIGSVEWIVITCEEDREDGWIMIPAENIISSCQQTGTKVAAKVDCAGDVGGLSRALELGVDALCVSLGDAIANAELWGALIEAKEERQSAAGATANISIEGEAEKKPSGPSIVQGTCRRVSSAGGKRTVLADRVCIDLVQSLRPSEGCFVGSSAKITALVLSEAAQSSFVPSRPFRVNAGPVHSYVVMGDGTSTKYLSELQAGDEVLVFDTISGKERPVAIGRLKIEVRPCVQIGLKVEPLSVQETEQAKFGQLFLQQAETVRLGQRVGDDSFIRITDLENTDDVGTSDALLRVVGFGTHVGKAYCGKVNEK